MTSLKDTSNENDIELPIDYVQSNFLKTNCIEPYKDVRATNYKLRNTKICKFVLENKSCPRTYCNFAHSVEMIQPLSCIFDGNCDYKTNGCSYFHKTETKEEYIKKNNLLITDLKQ